ncbi:MAG: hypothetical protein LAP85_23370 [Acidobacteriia bacterium]|nr:hypothetical protein [Terriglobia bacterium]
MIRAIDPVTEVEAKRRNGYFKVARAVAFATEDGKYADICFYSRRQGDSAPLVIKGEPAALKALLGLLYNSIAGDLS